MAQMRDIRPDLKARLELMARRRDDAEQRYEAELQGIDAEEAMIKSLLEAEERRIAAGYATMPRHPAAANDLENAILDILGDQRDWPHANVKAELIGRGIGKEDASFGRSVHATLLSMSNRGLVESVGMGVWRITKKAKEAA